MITTKIMTGLLLAALCVPALSYADTAGSALDESTAVEQPYLVAAADTPEAGAGETLAAQDDSPGMAQVGTPFSAPAGGATSKDAPPPGAGADDPGLAEEPMAEELIADPLEPFNRAMFHFNDKLYFWVMKPVAKGYSFVTPEPVRISVRDFFSNATMPIRFVSAVLQGKMKTAGKELARFGLNTTIGIGGLFDVAKNEFGISGQNEDIGQVFGHYGMGGGVYLVWPFLGPSNIRDTIGAVGDIFLNPVSYLNPWFVPTSVNAYNQINKTSLEIGEYEDLKEASLEPYTAVRDAYIQYRTRLINE